MEQTQATAAPEEFKGRLSPGKDWTEIVAWVGDLPPLPHVATQAIALVEDPDTTAGKLTALLGKDTALAARVLKIANSAMFSSQREITTLNQAIMVIGFKALKGIIVAATLRQLSRKFGKLEEMIWQNSVVTAIGCHTISQHLRKPYIDAAFLLGLLHDLGKLVLVRQIPQDYLKVVGLTKAGAPFNEVEQQHFGFAHPLIGALVAKKWNFSPETCQVILHHHDPIDAPFDAVLDEKTAIVQLADQIAHSLGLGHEEGYPDMADGMNANAAKFGISEADLEKLREEIQQAFQNQGSVYN